MASDPQKNGQKKKKAIQDTAQDEIFEAPVILREPTSRQIFLGHKLVLRVTAKGKPLPSFQWYLNGKKISGANSDRFAIMKTRRDHAGSYTCEAKNFVGKVMSRAAMVTFLVERVPELVVEPGIASIPQGKPFEFRVTSVDANQAKRLQIQWMFNGKRIRGANGPKLTFTEVKPKYEGEYKAVVILGGEIHSSNLVRLVVVPAEGVAVESPSKLIPMPTLPSNPEVQPYEELFFNPEDEPMDAAALLEGADPVESIPVSPEPQGEPLELLAEALPIADSPEVTPIEPLMQKKEKLERMLKAIQDFRGNQSLAPAMRKRPARAA